MRGKRCSLLADVDRSDKAAIILKVSWRRRSMPASQSAEKGSRVPVAHVHGNLHFEQALDRGAAKGDVMGDVLALRYCPAK